MQKRKYFTKTRLHPFKNEKLNKPIIFTKKNYISFYECY